MLDETVFPHEGQDELLYMYVLFLKCWLIFRDFSSNKVHHSVDTIHTYTCIHVFLYISHILLCVVNAGYECEWGLSKVKK